MKPDGPVPLLVAYAPTSTTDQQNPEESLRWQLDAARTLRAGRAEIVAVAHDKETSRSLPWSQRKRSARPTEGSTGPQPRLGRHRGRRAPARLWRHGPGPDCARPARPLRRPAVGARARRTRGPRLGDPRHHLVAVRWALPGRTQQLRVRVRTAMRAMAPEGRYLGGRPPYGYRLVRTGLPHPNPERARQGVQLTKLADAIFGRACVGKRSALGEHWVSHRWWGQARPNLLGTTRALSPTMR